MYDDIRGQKCTFNVMKPLTFDTMLHHNCVNRLVGICGFQYFGNNLFRIVIHVEFCR